MHTVDETTYAENNLTNTTPLPRVYRFTRHEDSTNPASRNNNDEEGLSQHGSQGCYSRPLRARPATSSGVFRLTVATGGGSGASSSGSRNAYPNSLQPWKPPLLFQFCKVCHLQ